MSNPYERLKKDYESLQKDFRIAHANVEQLRAQLKAQDERNIALRKEADAANCVEMKMIINNQTVDDSTIKSFASTFDRQMNNWAADLTVQFEQRQFASQSTEKGLLDPPLLPLFQALLHDLPGLVRATPAARQLSDGLDNTLRPLLHAYVRHALNTVLAKDMINDFFVTDSSSVNKGLAEIHAALLQHAPKPAAIWRLQTFRVAKIDLSPGVLHDILAARLPALTGLIAPSPSPLPTALLKLLEGGRLFGRMMHGTRDSSGGFYKAFLPSFGEPLDNARVELARRCARLESGNKEVVGACLFPGLIKVVPLDSGVSTATVIRRAVVSCECSIMPRTASSRASVSVAPAYEASAHEFPGAALPKTNGGGRPGNPVRQAQPPPVVPTAETLWDEPEGRGHNVNSW